LPTKNLTDALLRGLKSADGEIIDLKTGLIARADGAGRVGFSFRYRIDGVRRRFMIGLFPTIALGEARKVAGRVREQVRCGSDPQAERAQGRTAPAAMSFDELADIYLEKYAKRSKASWKYDEGLLRDARADWGQRPATSIVRQDVARLLLNVADRAPVVANRLRSVLGKLFSWSVDNALLDNNPTLGTKKPHREGRGKTRVLDDRELYLLWHAFDRIKASPGTTAALRVLLLLGQRPGEVAGMAADELHDLEDPRAALWSIPAHRMKGRRPHLVPLPPLACAIIRAELCRRPGAEFVFASRFRERARLARHTLSGSLARLIDELAPNPTAARLKASRPSPHDFRRTAVSGMSRLGVSRDDRMAVVAHAYSDTHSVYDQHDRLREKRRALEIWETHVRAVIAGEGGSKGAEVVALRREVL
jgi:integrase